MTLSGKIRRGPERKVLTAFTFRIQNEGWDDKIKGRCFFFFCLFFKQRKKTVEVIKNKAKVQILQRN